MKSRLPIHLAPGAAKAGFRLETFAALDSTSDEAMRRAAAGDPGRLWIVADEQSSGRGRHGRVWQSPPGNLYASLLLVDAVEERRTPQLGFVTGVAIVAALRDLCGRAPELRLKWPNDVLCEGAKLSGVLLDATNIVGHRACVIGCGVNCSAHPTGLAYAATNLMAMGFSGGPADVFVAFSRQMNEWLARWKAGANFAEVRQRWLDDAAGVDQDIQVAMGETLIEGIFRTIDAEGRLVVDTASGTQIVDGGEIFFPASRAVAAARMAG